MVAVRASHCLGKLVPLLPPESPLRAGSRATATVGREAAAWRAVADTSGAGAHPGVWELAWPTIVSNLLFSASGFIDIKIVGSLGASAVAAITTGTRIFFTAQAVLMAILAGTTALVARAWGAGHRDEAAQIAELSLWLCLVVSALLTLGGTLGADALAGLFRLEPQTVALAATFTRWLSVFYMAFAAVMALSTALRAAGDVVTPLWIGALGNVVSVFFTYSLVHGTFGLPALGVAGAAIGNGTGFVTGALLLTALWRSGRLAGGLRRLPVGHRAVRHRSICGLRHRREPSLLLLRRRFRVFCRRLDRGRSAARCAGSGGCHARWLARDASCDRRHAGIRGLHHRRGAAPRDV